MARQLNGFQAWPETVGVMTTQEVVAAYERGYAGAFHDPEASAELDESIRERGGMVDGNDLATAVGFAGDGAGKLTLLYPAVVQSYGFRALTKPGQKTGDCFPAGTKVRMADGSERPIEQVAVGEMVVSADGKPQRVTRTIAKPYQGQMATLHVKGYAHTVSATPDHRFVTYPKVWDKRINDHRYRWKRRSEERAWQALGDIKAGDYVSLPRISGCSASPLRFDLADLDEVRIDAGGTGRNLVPSDGKVRGHSCNSEVNRYIELDERLAWLLGLFLAEGSIDRNKNGIAARLTFNLHREEEFLAAQIATYVQDIFGVDTKEYRLPSKPNVLIVRICHMPVAQLFASLSGGNVYTKRVPWQLMAAKQSVRMATLRGWMDGDGCLSLRQQTGKDSKYRHCKLTGVSVSHELVRGMFDLANSCGLKASITRRKPRKQSRAASDLHLYGEHALAIYPEARTRCDTMVIKKRHHGITSHGLAVEVDRVTYEPFSGNVYCLEVENDHSFIAEGYGVHNCVSMAGRDVCLILVCLEALAGIVDEATGKIESVPQVSDRAASNGVFCNEGIYLHRGHNGQGMSCSQGVKWITTEGGVIIRQKYEQADLEAYNVQFELRGKSGSPEWMDEIARQHPIRDVTRPNDHEAARDYIGRGKPIWCCSGLGWANKRDANGYSKRQGSWSHSWHVVGYDDRESTVKEYGFPLALLGHRWAVWNSGGREVRDSAGMIPESQREKFKTLGMLADSGNVLIPEGYWWADARLLDKCDMYAVSGAAGWATASLPDFLGGFE